MEMKHTPGPWEFVPWHIAEGNPQVRAPEGWLLCETNSDANARLIAAAPDLLAALDLCRFKANRVYQMGDAETRRALEEIYTISNDAIAKAQG